MFDKTVVLSVALAIVLASIVTGILRKSGVI